MDGPRLDGCQLVWASDDGGVLFFQLDRDGFLEWRVVVPVVRRPGEPPSRRMAGQTGAPLPGVNKPSEKARRRGSRLSGAVRRSFLSPSFRSADDASHLSVTTIYHFEDEACSLRHRRCTNPRAVRSGKRALELDKSAGQSSRRLLASPSILVLRRCQTRLRRRGRKIGRAAWVHY